jgi:hypothetical protein
MTSKKKKKKIPKSCFAIRSLISVDPSREKMEKKKSRTEILSYLFSLPPIFPIVQVHDPELFADDILPRYAHFSLFNI